MSGKTTPTRIDGPVAVIGDVHGQAQELRRIIRQLERTPNVQNRWIVFIGDLVDRGPDTKGVLDLYCDLSRQHDKVTWVCGNHELAMGASLGLIDTPEYIDWQASWLHAYSVAPTFQSYGVANGDMDGLRDCPAGRPCNAAEQPSVECRTSGIPVCSCWPGSGFAV